MFRTKFVALKHILEIFAAFDMKSNPFVAMFSTVIEKKLSI